MDTFLGQVEHSQARLEGEEFHHAIRVLRLKPGHQLRLVDGKGHAFRARLRRVDLRAEVAYLDLLEPLPSGEPHHRVVLATAVPRGERMDYLVEKAVELGVAEIWPVVFARSVRVQAGRVGRWQRIARSAVKQSRRARVPEIHAPVPLKAWLDLLPRNYEGRVLHPQGDGAPSAVEPDSAVPGVLVVGPEGGLVAEEVAMLKDRGFRVWSLGERILRVETAAVVGLALWMHALGELA